MDTAKVFKSGNGRVVRLPKVCRFEGSEVYVNKISRAVILFPKDDPWDTLVASLDRFTPDFMAERAQPDLQDR